MEKYTIHRVIRGLTDEQVRENFPVFADFKEGTDNIRINKWEEELPDGTTVQAGYILERVVPKKPPHP